MGVSNSLDTLEKYSLKVHHSIEEVRSVVFTPYTHEAISALILEKLEQLRERGLQVELKMVNYVAKKLETVTKGDLRIVFEFVKELICEVLSQDTPSPSQPHCPITIDAVERVFRKMENSKADLIMSLPFSQKLLLMGTCAIISTEDVLFVDEKRLLRGCTCRCRVICGWRCAAWPLSGRYRCAS